MWWLEKRSMLSLRLAGVLGMAALLAGCFQPLYGERSVDGAPVIKTALSQVDIAQIPAANGTPEARIAVGLRNALLFGLNGGTPLPPTHRLDVRITSVRTSVVVDIKTSRPDVENYGLVASYSLVEISTGKTVLTNQALSRVSYDIPGGEQRFARGRALRDAENRAVNVIADNIRSRLASYFVTGT